MIQGDHDGLLELTLALIAADSRNPPGDERAAAELAARYVREELGATPLISAAAQNRTNVLARFAPASGPDENGLMLCGHLDTVALNDVRAWHPERCWGKLEAGRVYGLGACDMKGAVAAMLTAARQALASGRALRHPLMLLFTADEEGDCLGAKEFVNRHRRESAGISRAVVGEPTELYPVRAHKGCARITITTMGSAAHSSVPEEGVNAIYRMADAIAGLRELADELTARTDETGSPRLNVGTIQGGNSIFVVPDRCVIQVDRRILPSESRELILDDLRRTLARKQLEAELSFELLSPPLLTPRDAELVRALELLTGKPGSAVGYYTEAPLYAGCGMETVVCGPGSIRQAHRADEFVEIEQLRRAVEIYRALIERFCF